MNSLLHRGRNLDNLWNETIDFFGMCGFLKLLFRWNGCGGQGVQQSQEKVPAVVYISASSQNLG